MQSKKTRSEGNEMHYNQEKGIEASSRLTQEVAIRGIIQCNSTVYVRRAIIYLGCRRVGMGLLCGHCTVYGCQYWAWVTTQK
jgi:hypothetical protein